jgi:hypothetical protein
MRPAVSIPNEVAPPATIVVTIDESFEADARVVADKTDSGKEGGRRRMKESGNPPGVRRKPGIVIHRAHERIRSSLSQLSRRMDRPDVQGAAWASSSSPERCRNS